MGNQAPRHSVAADSPGEKAERRRDPADAEDFERLANVLNAAARELRVATVSSSMPLALALHRPAFDLLDHLQR